MSIAVGIIGAGNIFPAYLNNLRRARGIRLVGVADADADAARRRAEEFGLRSLGIEELLRSEAEVVLNLTPPLAHHATGLAVLNAGKHFFSEKPLAATFAQGQELVALARSRGLRLGCAPDTVLGAGAQTVRAALDAGTIGTVRHGCAFFMNHGPDHWHPNPAFFYQPGAGPLFDVGVYHLTHLVNHLGPIAAVRAVAHTTHRERTVPFGDLAGTKIPMAVPSHIVCHLSFAAGAQIVLTSSFDVWKHAHQPFEFYGDEGTLLGPDPNRFGGTVRVARPLGEFERVASSRPYHANARGLGLVDMVRAIEDRRAHRCSDALALHVLEAMEASLRSADAGSEVVLTTTCERPAPLDGRLF